MLLYNSRGPQLSLPRSRVWTKRGEGQGLGQGVGPMAYPMAHPMAYRWSIFFKTRLSIAASLCKQRATSICHTYDALLSSRRRLKFCTHTRGRLESEKPECRIFLRRRKALGTRLAVRPIHSVRTGPQLLSLASTFACLR